MAVEYGEEENWINHIPRLRHWLQFDYWNVADAALLLIDVDPEHSLLEIGTGELLSAQDFRGNLFDLADDDGRLRLELVRLARRARDIRQIWKSGKHPESEWTPRQWVEWAESKAMTVPWANWARKEGMLSAPTSASSLPEEPSKRAVDNLYRMIICMAVRGYTYDPNKRTDAVSQIVADMDLLGLPLSEDAVRGHLKTAAGFLPQADKPNSGIPKPS